MGLVDIIRGATQLFFECGGTPKKTSQSAISSNHLGRAIDLGHTVFSGKHDGLALYLARLLTPVWKLKVFDTRYTPMEPYAKRRVVI